MVGASRYEIFIIYCMYAFEELNFYVSSSFSRPNVQSDWCFTAAGNSGNVNKCDFRDIEFISFTNESRKKETIEFCSKTTRICILQ